jgi:hypothetical protein
VKWGVVGNGSKATPPRPLLAAIPKTRQQQTSWQQVRPIQGNVSKLSFAFTPLCAIDPGLDIWVNEATTSNGL